MSLALGRLDINADAVRNLERMKKNGFDVDPLDKDQLKVYSEMRSWCKRVTGAAFEEYIKNKTNQIESGAKFRLCFWAVPRTNFPKGLPDIVRENIVDDETLLAFEASGGYIDHDTYHIVDQLVPRHQLGKNVVALETYTADSARCKKTAEMADAAHGQGARK